jgi:7-cyano-7-deazaguanine synthase
MTIAVLLSAGLDSAVMAAHYARTARVHPIYVSAGLAWEREELQVLDRLLAAPPLAMRTEPLVRLAFSATDLYPATHWALQGTPPAFDTPDRDVYLVGRNIMLLGKAGIHCAQVGIHELALGILSGNPFPDATPEFLQAMSNALTRGLQHEVRVSTPFADRHKEQVVELGARLGVPFELTLSCMNPRSSKHCGQCSKCRERRDAFAAVGIEDPAEYATKPIR